MDADIEDDDLVRFEAHGADPLPAAEMEGWLDHDGARIWHASYGHGPPVVLLHGGLGHAGNWGYQVLAILSAGYRAILIDSCGHGRSTRDDRPYSYERMASDVLAVIDALGIDSARFVGWSGASPANHSLPTAAGRGLSNWPPLSMPANSARRPKRYCRSARPARRWRGSLPGTPEARSRSKSDDCARSGRLAS
jgi:alpha/beta hydrolase fold